MSRQEGWSVEEFSVLYERHVDEVFRYLARRVGPDHAEDLTAQTFTEAWAGRRRFDSRHGDAARWLQGIASNHLKRHRRGDRRRFHAYRRAAGQRAVAVDTPCEDEVSSRIMLEQALPALRRGLDKLSAGERDILLLHSEGELTYQDMARTLDIPVGTVRSRLSRGRARLAVDLDEVHP